MNVFPRQKGGITADQTETDTFLASSYRENQLSYPQYPVVTGDSVNIVMLPSCSPPTLGAISKETVPQGV